ncbi:MAG: hypothetical protein NVS4B11_29230 [Ktedonobacteraceae bacterium]
MLRYRASVICTIILFCLALLTACAGLSAPDSTTVHTAPTALPSMTPVSRTPTTIATTTPTQYTSHVLLRAVGRPDDLVFDREGRLLFSDFYNGTISRVNANGSITVLQRGLAGPEGMVMLNNGTLIIAEQQTNRILALAPGASFPTMLRALPGTPSKAHCKDGVDGIGLDSTDNTLIVPDSPTGDVYRMSLDGKKLTLLASGITRPVGVAVDTHGTMYVADECGGALWQIASDGKSVRMGNFGMLDDVVLDGNGNVLVTDLAPSIHALVRMNVATGKRETLASRGFIEPQGLAIDAHGNIYVSDDYANVIVAYTPL